MKRFSHLLASLARTVASIDGEVVESGVDVKYEGDLSAVKSAERSDGRTSETNHGMVLGLCRRFSGTN